MTGDSGYYEKEPAAIYKSGDHEATIFDIELNGLAQGMAECTCGWTHQSVRPANTRAAAWRHIRSHSSFRTATTGGSSP